MATITGLTAERMLDIEAASVVDGSVIEDRLILTKYDGTQIDAGIVKGDQGIQGVEGPEGPAGSVPMVEVGTSLPGSPTNKQLAVLVDSLTLPTYSWMFQYMSGISDAYKWVFCGGAPAYKRDSTSNSTTSSTFVNYTDRVNFTVPRAGYYHIQHEAHVDFRNMIASVKLGSVSALDSNGIGMASGASLPSWGVRSIETTSPLSVSDVIELQFRSTDSASRAILAKQLIVTPMRVS